MYCVLLQSILQYRLHSAPLHSTQLFTPYLSHLYLYLYLYVAEIHPGFNATEGFFHNFSHFYLTESSPEPLFQYSAKLSKHIPG